VGKNQDDIDKNCTYFRRHSYRQRFRPAPWRT